MYIETPRMVVRDFMPEDAADLHAILGDDETMKFCEPAYSPEKTKDFLHTFCIDRKGAVAAVHRESGTVIGYILFCDQGDGVYEMGWFFHRGFWRQGYAYEACKAVVDHAFEQRCAHKIFAETIDAAKSVSLMKKLGMQPEGIQRNQVKDLQGQWANLFLYGLLEEDWKKHTAP